MKLKHPDRNSDGGLGPSHLSPYTPRSQLQAIQRIPSDALGYMPRRCFKTSQFHAQDLKASATAQDFKPWCFRFNLARGNLLRLHALVRTSVTWTLWQVAVPTSVGHVRLSSFAMHPGLSKLQSQHRTCANTLRFNASMCLQIAPWSECEKLRRQLTMGQPLFCSVGRRSSSHPLAILNLKLGLANLRA